MLTFKEFNETLLWFFLLPSSFSIFLEAANFFWVITKQKIWTLVDTHIILHQVWVVSFNAVIQDGDHNILSSVTSLPSTYYIHIWLAMVGVVTAVLGREEEIKMLDIGDYWAVRDWDTITTLPLPLTFKTAQEHIDLNRNYTTSTPLFRQKTI